MKRSFLKETLLFVEESLNEKNSKNDLRRLLKARKILEGVLRDTEDLKEQNITMPTAQRRFILRIAWSNSVRHKNCETRSDERIAEFVW